MSKSTATSPTSLPLLLIVLLPLLLTHLSFCSGFSAVGAISGTLDESSSTVLRNKEARNVCSGTIGECLTDSPEMDSEISRRMLLMKRYISYETLKRDIVPCMRPGASYYNCGGGQANPYSRGCEIISGCRS